MNRPTYELTHRRPIRSRGTRWADITTRWLAQCAVTPNTISMLGMLAAIAAGASFYLTSHVSPNHQWMLWLLGASLCQVRLLCNLFDGMVAVRLGIQSAVGELYNEVPDRVSDAVVLIALGYSAGASHELGYVAALVAVFVAYVRTQIVTSGAPNDFSGPMAKPHRMFVVSVVAVYVAFAPASWQVPFHVINLALGVIIGAGLLTAVRRLSRAVRHLKAQAP